MKNILLLTDFTQHSDNAISYATQLFADSSCHFYVLNVVKVWEYTTDDLMTGAASQSVYETVLAGSKQRLQKKVDILTNRYTDQDFTFTAVTDYDVFTDAIHQAVVHYDIDCIILGSNGKSDFIERVFGSHATRVLRRVDCPLLVVPYPYTYKPVAHVLISLDASKSYKTAIFDLVFKLFYKQPLTASVLQLSDTPVKTLEADLEQAAQDFKQAEVPFFKIPASDSDKTSKLMIIEQVLKTDLNVMCITPKGLLKRLFGAPVVAQIIQRTEIPTLFIKD